MREDASQHIGDFHLAVITVPAYFDEIRRKAIQDAGYLSGIEVLDIINEPTAAAIAYGYQHDHAASDGQTILVYDLGGGTFDVTIVKIESKEYRALATDGDVKLGGIDWDERLVNYLAEEFISNYSLDPRDDKNSLGELWQHARQTKHALSNAEEWNVEVTFQMQTLSVTITRDHFE